MSPQVVALSGGVGGAKLALGLSRVLNDGELLVVANTGDDFEHLGFLICPDIDTLVYTLGGVNNPETGWGRADETWNFMASLRQQRPADSWFQLGDKDLETHRARRAWLRDGADLTEVTSRLARHFGVPAEIVPMSDDPVRTHVLATMPDGREAWLPFQDYFVRWRCAPVTRAVEFRGAAQAAMSRRLEQVLRGGDVRTVVICPSNPYLSIDPILAVPAVADRLRECGATIVAISPVIGGRAIKGPTAKMMAELGLESDVLTIARHYAGVIDGLVIDAVDRERRASIESLGIRVLVTGTLMSTLDDRVRLAGEVLAFAAPH